MFYFIAYMCYNQHSPKYIFNGGSQNIMNNKLSALTASLFAVIGLFMSSLVECFALGDGKSITPTGDSSTIIVVITAVLMVAAIITIVILSIKKK